MPTDKPTLEEQVATIAAAVARIETAIKGDPAMGQVGLVARQSETELRVATIEQQRASEAAEKRGIISTLTILGSASAAIGACASWIVTHFTGK